MASATPIEARGAVGTRGPDRASPTDAALVRAAQSGDDVALADLLERHRPRLHAAALRMLGYGPRAEDAVQEALLVALTRLDQLREPDAVGGWLHAILRNVAKAAWRANHRERPVDDESLAALAGGFDPEAALLARLDRRADRDRVWAAVNALGEPLRAAVVLRYFSEYSSYEQIARVLRVPVGTVRSRLAEARGRLLGTLSEGPPPALGAVRAARTRANHFAETWDRVYRGGKAAWLSMFARDLVVVLGGRAPQFGRRVLEREIDGDLAAGVGFAIDRTVAAGELVVVEGRFLNPPEDPSHCPPGAVGVFSFRGGLVRHARLHLAPRGRRG